MTLNNPAIVLGGGSANGLGIARNLGSLGINVYCLTSNAHEATLASKYCTGARIIPRIEQDPVLLQSVLQRLTPRFQGAGVLFPTTDTALLTVAAVREHLEGYTTFIPRQEIVETMVVKSKFYQSLEAHGIPHPQTLDPLTMGLDAITRKITFPVFIRPVQSLLFHERIGGKGFIANTERELERYLRVMRRMELDAIVQEIVYGPPTAGYTLWGYMDHASRLIVLIVSQKVRKPQLFSNSCIEVTVPRTRVADIDSMILEYLYQLQYTGLFGVECKRDPRDGRFKVLEVNARSMGGNHWGIVCGANHILAAYRDALGEIVTPQLSYRAGIYHIDLFTDLWALILQAMRRQLSLSDFHYYLQNKHWHLLSRDDPLPSVKEAMHLIPSFLRVLHRGFIPDHQGVRTPVSKT